MLCRLTSKLLSEREPRYASAIDSFVGTFLVVAGKSGSIRHAKKNLTYIILVIAAFDLSGGYYNPVLATGLKFGCKGHSHMEFAAVYWVGASLGAIASIFTYPMLRGLLGAKEKSE